MDPVNNVRGQAARVLVEELTRQGTSVPEDLLLAMVVDDGMFEVVSRILVSMRDGDLPEEMVLGLPYLVSDLEENGVGNIEAWLAEVRPRAADIEAYKDLWAEAHCALTLSR